GPYSARFRRMGDEFCFKVIFALIARLDQPIAAHHLDVRSAVIVYAIARYRDLKFQLAVIRYREPVGRWSNYIRRRRRLHKVFSIWIKTTAFDRFYRIEIKLHRITNVRNILKLQINIDHLGSVENRTFLCDQSPAQAVNRLRPRPSFFRPGKRINRNKDEE